MRYLFTGLLLFLALMSQAQPSLKDIENYSAGSHSTYIKADDSGFAPGNGGANITWDFSSLQLQADTLRQWIVKPSETAYGSQFPQATLTEKNSDSTFVFFTNDNAAFKMMGFADQNSGITIKFLQYPVYVERPMTYLDSVRTNFKDTYTLSGTTVNGGGTSFTRADGYGTLKLLGGKTYTDVLRLRIEQDYSDTSFGQVVNTQVVTYVWFNAAHRAALMKYDSTHVYGNFVNQTTTGLHILQDEFINTGISSVQPMSFTAEPTMNGKLMLTGTTSQTLIISLYTLEGKQIRNQPYHLSGNQVQVLDLGTESLRTGLYLVRISDGQHATCRKILVNNY